jgi:AraC-like DNA-binding protein
MATQALAASTIRFRTADYAPRERLAAWHDVYGQALLNLEIEPVRPDNFHADVRLCRLPGLAMMTGSRSGAIYRRKQDAIDSDNFVISFGLSGGLEAAQLGRTAAMEKGDAVVVTASEPGYVSIPCDGPGITLCAPASAIAGLGRPLCRRIPAENPALRLLAGYVGVLEEAKTLSDPALQRHAVMHVYDLIALALGTTGEAAEIAKNRGARVARLRSIKDDVKDNLASDLSIAAVAARHRLPVRYVQRLFEADGVTFTDFVLEQRLAHAHRMLIDPRLANLKIGAVAAESGFSDPSYFNRTFRRRYGATPSGLRPTRH